MSDKIGTCMSFTKTRVSLLYFLIIPISKKFWHSKEDQKHHQKSNFIISFSKIAD